MPEEYKLEGQKFPIRDPKDDGLRLVQEKWSSKVRVEGSTAHWTYLLDVPVFDRSLGKMTGERVETIVGEAWFVGRLLTGTWYVRIKEKT